jgi:hypothetical protein
MFALLNKMKRALLRMQAIENIFLEKAVLSKKLEVLGSSVKGLGLQQ